MMIVILTVILNIYEVEYKASIKSNKSRLPLSDSLGFHLT